MNTPDPEEPGELVVSPKWRLVYAGVVVFAVATMLALWHFSVTFTP